MHKKYSTEYSTEYYFLEKEEKISRYLTIKTVIMEYSMDNWAQCVVQKN